MDENKVILLKSLLLADHKVRQTVYICGESPGIPKRGWLENLTSRVMQMKLPE